jgi:inner membrane protein
MPTVFTHALVGLGVAEVLAPRPMPAAYFGLSALLSAAPDVDVLAFRFGIPYSSRFGHRGFSHSLLCAALAGALAATLSASWLGVSWWFLASVFMVSTAVHGLLDGITNGGMGVAYFAPFDNTRYFFPWRPVQVSPLGRGFFSAWGLRAVLSEVVWVWLPTGLLVVLTLLGRMAGGHGPLGE